MQKHYRIARAMKDVIGLAIYIFFWNLIFPEEIISYWFIVGAIAGKYLFDFGKSIIDWVNITDNQISRKKVI